MIRVIVSGTLEIARERPEKFRPQWDSNADLCEACEVLYHLSYQANWELAVMWVYDNPVDGGYMYLVSPNKWTNTNPVF